MINDYECKECGLKQEIRTAPGEEPKCKKCGGEVKRVWTFGGGIKTGDGYKT